VSITAPQGFTAAAVSCGIKDGGALDLAIIAGAPGTIGTAMFTTNRAAAAPVVLSRAHLAAGPAFRAVTINSGCANAATGDRGDSAALAMAETTALALGCQTEEVFVASTGAIGPQLPVMRVTTGIESAAKRLASGAIADRTAATAIMTTDTSPKQALARDEGIAVGGIAKGAGMVRPGMATMLVALTTDAAVAPDTLHRLLVTAVDRSFHSLNIDGCQSTNDAVFLLASGAGGVEADETVLGGLLGRVCDDLRHQLAEDAEGASRVVTIAVSGARDDATARAAGMAIADSALVRAMFYSGDPNWGRIVGALGASDVDYDPAQVSVGFGGTLLALGGTGLEADGAVVEVAGDFTVDVGLGDGPGTARIVTTDLTPDYVIFNSEYS
jgi:glutamate N-acetyltransferase/amino-acid N-acetyltransferase